MLPARTRLLVVVAIVGYLIPVPAQAVIIPAYFGWNYVFDSLPAPPAVAELTSVTYTGGAGAGILLPMPVFPLPALMGMPDGIGSAPGPPVFTAGGDGESTRSIGVTLPIDWVPAGAPAPYLPAPVPFPTIGISSFTVSAGGFPMGVYSGFPVVNNAGGPTPDYVVGLITSGASTELVSLLLNPLGDIYTPDNPSLTATSLGGDIFTVTFAAAVPEPSSLVLAALGGAGLAFVWRRRANKRR